MAPLWLTIGSLSLGETRRFLMVLPPLKWVWMSYLPQIKKILYLLFYNILCIRFRCYWPNIDGKGLFYDVIVFSLYFILFWSYSISFLFYFIFILLDLLRHRCYSAGVHNFVNFLRHRCYSAGFFLIGKPHWGTDVTVQRSIILC